MFLIMSWVGHRFMQVEIRARLVVGSCGMVPDSEHMDFYESVFWLSKRDYEFCWTHELIQKTLYL